MVSEVANKSFESKGEQSVKEKNQIWLVEIMKMEKKE